MVCCLCTKLTCHSLGRLQALQAPAPNTAKLNTGRQALAAEALCAAQNQCTQPVGSCLANQLTGLKASDDARILAGTTPVYYVSRWGGGLPEARQVSKFQH